MWNKIIGVMTQGGNRFEPMCSAIYVKFTTAHIKVEFTLEYPVQVQIREEFENGN